MKAIIRTVEKVVGYEACDGVFFSTEDACKNYEKTAICVAGEAVKKLTVRDTNAEFAFGHFCTCYDDAVWVFDIKTAEDLNRINTLLKLQSDENDVIDPKYIGSKVAFRYYCGENYGMLHGTRAEMETEFSTLMDKLFKEADADVES